MSRSKCTLCENKTSKGNTFRFGNQSKFVCKFCEDELYTELADKDVFEDSDMDDGECDLCESTMSSTKQFNIELEKKILKKKVCHNCLAIFRCHKCHEASIVSPAQKKQKIHDTRALVWKHTPYDHLEENTEFTNSQLIREGLVRNLIIAPRMKTMSSYEILDLIRSKTPSKNWFKKQAEMIRTLPMINVLESWTNKETCNEIKTLFRQQNMKSDKTTNLIRLWRKLPALDQSCILFSGRGHDDDMVCAGMYQAMMSFILDHKTDATWISPFPMATSWKYDAAVPFAGRKMDYEAYYMLQMINSSIVDECDKFMLRLHCPPGIMAIWVHRWHLNNRTNRKHISDYVEILDEHEILLPPYLKFTILQFTIEASGMLIIDVNVRKPTSKDMPFQFGLIPTKDWVLLIPTLDTKNKFYQILYEGKIQGTILEMKKNHDENAWDYFRHCEGNCEIRQIWCFKNGFGYLIDRNMYTRFSKQYEEWIEQWDKPQKAFLTHDNNLRFEVTTRELFTDNMFPLWP